MERVPGSTAAQTRGSSQGGQEEVTEQAKQQTGQLARQARQQTTQLANRGTEQLKSQLATQKHQGAQRMMPIQAALRETSQQLRSQGQGSVAHYADNAADQVERFSRYLRENEVDQILDEARSFARRRPGLFVGGAVAVGFFASRFLKSSSEGGASAGDGSSEETPSATSRAVVSHGTGEPATALPPGAAIEGESPTTERPPTAGQPLLGDRERAHTEELPAEPAEPPPTEPPPTRGSS